MGSIYSTFDHGSESVSHVVFDKKKKKKKKIFLRFLFKMLLFYETYLHSSVD